MFFDRESVSSPSQIRKYQAYVAAIETLLSDQDRYNQDMTWLGLNICPIMGERYPNDIWTLKYTKPEKIKFIPPEKLENLKFRYEILIEEYTQGLCDKPSTSSGCQQK